MSCFTFTRYYYFQRYGPYGHHVVDTLDPIKFAEKKQRRLHIGNQLSFRPPIVLRNQSSRASVRLFYDSTPSQIHHPYPPDTTGFLYYFTPPGKPRISGEIHFRIASNDDHVSFESGSDLLRLNGQPWSRSLYTVSKYHIPLYEKLREEGFVPDDLDAVLSTFPPKIRTCHHLYTLDDTFILDFEKMGIYFTVITEKGMERVKLGRPCAEKYLRKLRAPYTGSALARFERSTHPDHKGTRTVVLRFLKIIRPVKCVIPFYDDYIVSPKEGELHRRCKTRHDLSNPPVWSVDIDKSVSMLRGLRLIWDT